MKKRNIPSWQNMVIFFKNNASKKGVKVGIWIKSNKKQKMNIKNRIFEY